MKSRSLVFTKKRVVRSLDATRLALNTVAHAVEHRAVDAGSLGVLGSAIGRQVWVRRSRDHFALYTSSQSLDASESEVHIGPRGRRRLFTLDETTMSTRGPPAREASQYISKFNHNYKRKREMS